MPFQSQRAVLELDKKVQLILDKIRRSRTESIQRVERAKMILNYAAGLSISRIAGMLKTNRPKVERCIDKALEFGAIAALSDLPRKGRPPEITEEAKAWVISLACQKPKDLEYPEETWTMQLLAEHIHKHCSAMGHPSLEKLARGTVSKILSSHDIQPHKISYYLERRDPDFDQKMGQVLSVYKRVEVLRAQNEDSEEVFISYDEKPGIQAIGNVAPDLPPVPGRHTNIGRDYEYKRHGTLSLMAGLNLMTGYIHNAVVDQHRSFEFVSFLKQLDANYPNAKKINIILDNHSAHKSKETCEYLASVPNRFEFIFTPKHGSWLNLVECFFSKMARTLLRGIRVDSKDELKNRIVRYIERSNLNPVVFHWRYRMNEVFAAPSH
jgi:transposase